MNIEQKLAEEKERKIARFKNIDNESFTHSFRGVSITVQAGEEYIGRLPEVEHLAKHLARKMLSREAKKKSSKEKTIKLWTPEQIEIVMGKIVTVIGKKEPKETLAPKEKRDKDAEDLKDEFTPEKPALKEPPKVSKKDVIKELEKRGVKPDVKKTLEELLKELMELEAQGK